MIRVSEVLLDVSRDEEELLHQTAACLKIRPEEIERYEIVRKSIDARKKPKIRFSYILDVSLREEAALLRRMKKNIHVSRSEKAIYALPNPGNERLLYRPVVAGFGPAGIFAALALARKGFAPIILERGEDVDARSRRVEAFWKTGELCEDSNVSFGEGGAGTFSDGKLNTMVKDRVGRNTEVLKTFVEFGADGEILYLQKPHIGTDRLIEIIRNIRKEIIRLGGSFRFQTALSDIRKNPKSKREKERQSYTLLLSDGGQLQTELLILAIGHSARDSFQMLYERELPMEAKPFAVGVRIQHPQSMIDLSQFGPEYASLLSPASYKLTAKSRDERGVYSFCMCPGGYVVDASTEKGMLAVNGMSYHARDSKTANSAIIVTVSPEDFRKYAPFVGAEGGSSSAGIHPLSGIEFQRALERKAYEIGGGRIPVQLLGDFMNGRESGGYKETAGFFKGRTGFAPLHEVFPEEIRLALKDAMPIFDRKIRGFGREDAILAGVESRTSSPLRILRGEDTESSFEGIYPCGEGAGYAGGITSAAMDGLKVAENIIARYRLQDA